MFPIFHNFMSKLPLTIKKAGFPAFCQRVIFAPQFVQKASSPSSSLPHAGQCSGSCRLLPQVRQKWEPSLFSVWQDGQIVLNCGIVLSGSGSGSGVCSGMLEIGLTPR